MGQNKKIQIQIDNTISKIEYLITKNKFAMTTNIKIYFFKNHLIPFNNQKKINGNFQE